MPPNTVAIPLGDDLTGGGVWLTRTVETVTGYTDPDFQKTQDVRTAFYGHKNQKVPKKKVRGRHPASTPLLSKRTEKQRVLFSWSRAQVSHYKLKEIGEKKWLTQLNRRTKKVAGNVRPKGGGSP